VFNSFCPHDDIGALERPQIPENDKGASCQRQILLLLGSLKPFVFGMPTLCVPSPLWLAIRLLASGDLKQDSGPQEKLQLTGLVWHALSTRLCSLVRWSGLLLLPHTDGPTLSRWLTSYNSGRTCKGLRRQREVRPELTSFLSLRAHVVTYILIPQIHRPICIYALCVYIYITECRYLNAGVGVRSVEVVRHVWLSDLLIPTRPDTALQP